MFRNQVQDRCRDRDEEECLVRSLTIDVSLVDRDDANAIQTIPSSTLEELIRCPIQYEIMSDPVIVVETGDTYDYDNIRQWFERSSKNPLSNETLQSKQLIPNRLAKQIIDLYCTSNPDKTTCRHVAREKQTNALRQAWAIPLAPPTQMRTVDEINQDMQRLGLGADQQRQRRIQEDDIVVVDQRRRLLQHATSYYTVHHILWILLNLTFAIVQASMSSIDRNHVWNTIVSVCILSVMLVWHATVVTITYIQYGTLQYAPIFRFISMVAFASNVDHESRESMVVPYVCGLFD
jgi:hypothetical protein